MKHRLGQAKEAALSRSRTTEDPRLSALLIMPATIVIGIPSRYPISVPEWSMVMRETPVNGIHPFVYCIDTSRHPALQRQ